MLEELEVLGIVGERLEAARLPYMLTGSFAMAYYGRPRMTRDLDIVVALREDGVTNLVASLDESMDRAYLERWANELGVAADLAEIAQ